MQKFFLLTALLLPCPAQAALQNIISLLAERNESSINAQAHAQSDVVMHPLSTALRAFGHGAFWTTAACMPLLVVGYLHQQDWMHYDDNGIELIAIAPGIPLLCKYICDAGDVTLSRLKKERHCATCQCVTTASKQKIVNAWMKSAGSLAALTLITTLVHEHFSS